MTNYKYDIKITCNCEDNKFPYNAIEIAQSWYNSEHIEVGSEEYETFANEIDGLCRYENDGKTFCFCISGNGPSKDYKMKKSLETTALWLMDEYDKVQSVNVAWTLIKDTPDGEITTERK